ncbi:MAG: N-acetyl-gamma-glutamyl-phosphate reductase [Chitinophagales bacterium]|nr:N-acetyl-gamma-glutamyl-phosphate reductase [Chitinophagales bacterium]
MKKKVGIVGAAGYTGGELVRILLFHPLVELTFAYSRSQAGKSIDSIHSDLIGDTDLKFTDIISKDIDILFLALPHGQAKIFLEEHSFAPETIIIDLSNDFRLQKDAGDFIYGLPEFQREKIKTAKRIANPGCFATGIQLGLLPLANASLLQSDIHISSITGSTGAGLSLSPTTHFTWRNNNISTYKMFDHQHLGEIGETLLSLQKDFKHYIYMMPYRGDFPRGIFTTIYTSFDGTTEDAQELYRAFYKSHPFTYVTDVNPDLKQVVNTNKCVLFPFVKNGQIAIISIEDNLLKGASGQAVQNMNLMMGWEETIGLKLKASAF